jgi:alkylhydroperoxidase/carboxymuconolactone decarboxylase family protein YurZ
METKTKLLIAIGAAVVANCQPCLKTLLKKAKENAVEEKEVLEAIGVARVVRKNSITQIDKFLAGLAGTEEASGNAEDGCGCT